MSECVCVCVHVCQVSYKPADSRDVEALAKSCSPMCAEGDTVDQGDGGWCDVVNAKVRAPPRQPMKQSVSEAGTTDGPVQPRGV